MSVVLAAAVGLVVAGPFGAAAGVAIPLIWQRWSARPTPGPPLTLVIMLVLIELRSGVSVLAALEGASRALPDDSVLRTVTRVARVSGLIAALSLADDRLRPMLAQLARAQKSGASLTDSMRRLLEMEMAAEKARRIARARTLPVRLMLPVTLLMLPGLVLFLYAPSLLAMFDDLTGVLT